MAEQEDKIPPEEQEPENNNFFGEESNNEEPEETQEYSPPQVESKSPMAAVNNIAASTVAASQEAAESVKSFTKTNTGMTIVILAFGVIFAFVVAYIIYWFIDYTVNERQVYLMKASKLPIVATRLTTLSDDDKIPNSTNGKRATIAFWIYIYDLNKYPDSEKHVFHRGDEAGTFENSSPYIVLDKSSNKLHITFAPNKPEKLYDYSNTSYAPNTSGTTPVGITDPDQRRRAARILRGITIDYIPVQRWVNVAVVVNEEVNGGTITAYLDGELVKSINSRSTYAPDSSNSNKSYNTVTYVDPSTSISKTVDMRLSIFNADLDKKGHVYVGGSSSGSSGVGFSGMVSKITFANFDMNAKDVYDNYLNGPIDSLLAKMGLPAYGVQAPIYKIE